MRLSAKILENVSNVNHWNYANEAYAYEGQANTIYLQLVDLAKSIQVDDNLGSISDYPMRYISQATSVSLVARFSSVDSAKEFDITGSKPFADDKSIWKFDLASTKMPRTGNLTLILTEDGVARSFIVKSVIVAELLNVGGC